MSHHGTVFQSFRLARWAHDSKTAPRFIKYNMLQSMHLQEAPLPVRFWRWISEPFHKWLI